PLWAPPAYARPCRDHDVAADDRAAQRADPGPGPAAGPDGRGGVARPLPPDGDAGVGVAVVLVGDVHVRAGENVIADHDRVMGDDMAAPADEAPVADPQDRRLAQ